MNININYLNYYKMYSELNWIDLRYKNNSGCTETGIICSDWFEATQKSKQWCSGEKHFFPLGNI